MGYNLIYEIALWYHGRNSPLSWNAFFGDIKAEEIPIIIICRREIESINYFSMTVDEIYDFLNNKVNGLNEEDK